MNHEGLYVSHQPTGFGKTHLGLAGGSGSLGGYTLKLPKGLVSEHQSDWPDSEVRSLPFGRRGHPVVRIFSFGPVARHPMWTYNVNCGPRGPAANRN